MKNKHHWFLFTCIFIMVLCTITCAPKKKDDNREKQDQEEIEENIGNEIPGNMFDAEGRNMENEPIPEEEDMGDPENPEPVNQFLREQEKKIKMMEMEELVEPEESASYAVGSQKYLSLLPQLPVTPIYPEDFRIGNLHKKEETSADARAIGDRIAGFFLAMKNKIIDKSYLIMDETGSELYRLLMYHIGNEHIPLDFRIGTVNIENTDTAFATVRLFGEKGETLGDVYMKKKENEWYISDMQVNFYDLEIPVQENQEKFMPSTYRWLYEGM